MLRKASAPRAGSTSASLSAASKRSSGLFSYMAVSAFSARSVPVSETDALAGSRPRIAGERDEHPDAGGRFIMLSQLHGSSLAARAASGHPGNPRFDPEDSPPVNPDDSPGRAYPAVAFAAAAAAECGDGIRPDAARQRRIGTASARGINSRPAVRPEPARGA